MSYCNLNSALALELPLTFHCRHDNLTSFLCILLKFVLHVDNSQFSDKFMAGKIIKMADLLHKMANLFGFITFYLPVTSKVLHLLSSYLFCMLLITSFRTSLIMAGKKITDLLPFFTFYVANFTLWTR